MSSAKLYVGNLNYSTSEDSVRQAFGEYGEVVSVSLIIDRETGRPKGFGFVEMASPEQAEAARNALNGTDLDGRTIKVDSAKEQQPRFGGGGRGGYAGGGGGSRGYGGGGSSYGGGGRRW